MFNLVLNTGAEKDKKALGEKVFVENLPAEFSCYALYYPGAMPAPELENALREVGRKTGGNLFVNIGSLNDPNYNKIATLFEIRRSPVIVITAIAPLAAPANEFVNAYVRLDEPKLLASREQTLNCVVEVFNLFHQGEISQAIDSAGSSQRGAQLNAIVQALKKPLAFLWDFISERDIVVSFAEGRLELTKPKKDD